MANRALASIIYPNSILAAAADRSHDRVPHDFRTGAMSGTCQTLGELSWLITSFSKLHAVVQSWGFFVNQRKRYWGVGQEEDSPGTRGMQIEGPESQCIERF
jgi:hypothetical protein